MATLRKPASGQFNGSTGKGAVAPNAAPNGSATLTASMPVKGRRPALFASSITCSKCDKEVPDRDWDGEQKRDPNGELQDVCSQCVFDWDDDAENDAPRPKPQLTPEQYAQMKRVLYPTRQDIAEVAGDPIAQSQDNAARRYWTQVMAGEIDPNAIDDPWN